MCKCDCGNIVLRSRATLEDGRSFSCGCVTSRKGVNKKHGMTRTRIYSIWLNMRNRCRYDNPKDTPYYKGKGIKVCDEWDASFEAFYKWALSNGYDETLSIERLDINGNYEPNNCCWISILEQQQNKSTTVYIDYYGKTMRLRELCKKLNFPYKKAHRRHRELLKQGLASTADKIFF